MRTDFADLPLLQVTVFSAVILFALVFIVFIRLGVRYLKKTGAAGTEGSDLYLECAYFSEIGKRPRQEDALFVSELDQYKKYGVTALVADGMGGMLHGADISQRVVDFVSSMCPMSFFAADKNAEELRELSNTLYDEYNLTGGSTIAMVHISGMYLNYYSVGDSDIILVRNGVATILNPRQNYLSLLIKTLCGNNKQTDTAYGNAKARSLVDFMGNKNPRVIYTKKPIRIFDGDKIIVSSDGLTDAVSIRSLTKYVKDSAKSTAVELKHAVELRKRPKQDNYTAIVLGVRRGYL